MSVFPLYLPYMHFKNTVYRISLFSILISMLAHCSSPGLCDCDKAYSSSIQFFYDNMEVYSKSKDEYKALSEKQPYNDTLITCGKKVTSDLEFSIGLGILEDYRIEYCENNKEDNFNKLYQESIGNIGLAKQAVGELCGCLQPKDMGDANQRCFDQFFNDEKYTNLLGGYSITPAMAHLCREKLELFTTMYMDATDPEEP